MLRLILNLPFISHSLYTTNQTFPGIIHINTLLTQDLIDSVQCGILVLIQMLRNFNDRIHADEMIDDLCFGVSPTLLFFLQFGELDFEVLLLGFVLFGGEEPFQPFFYCLFFHYYPPMYYVFSLFIYWN